MGAAQITVLLENTVNRPGLLAEHGLSFWIELGSRRVLFDTGQSDILLRNAEILGVDLREVDAIVLSHGHYDHVGGLKEILQMAPAAPVYFHPKALEPKFARNKESARQIGIEPEVTEMLRERVANGPGFHTNGPMAVLPGVTVTGEIPRNCPFEDTGGPFYLDHDCTRPDELLDDQALVLETGAGLVVVLGCAHAGVVNTLDYIAGLFPGRSIRMVLGGMHLVRASRSRITHTIEAIGRHNVEQIGPAHCTGSEAKRELWNALPQKCFTCNVGARIML